LPAAPLPVAPQDAFYAAAGEEEILATQVMEAEVGDDTQNAGRAGTGVTPGMQGLTVGDEEATDNRTSSPGKRQPLGPAADRDRAAKRGGRGGSRGRGRGRPPLQK
jgi:hypothetical protein